MRAILGLVRNACRALLAPRKRRLADPVFEVARELIEFRLPGRVPIGAPNLLLEYVVIHRSDGDPQCDPPCVPLIEAMSLGGDPVKPDRAQFMWLKDAFHQAPNTRLGPLRTLRPRILDHKPTLSGRRQRGPVSAHRRQRGPRGMRVHFRAGQAATFRSVDEPESPSKRLVEQRLRNRAMEALVALSEGDAGVRSVGVGEYVEQFFDTVNDDSPWHWRDWSCFTPEEVERLDAVHELLKAACAATPHITTDDDFIASGWPGRIQPAARRALDVMQARGRFREDVEEETPSG
jgi:hypothetical protein